MNANEVEHQSHAGETEYAPPPRRLYTLKNFAKRHASFTTLSGLTNQVFDAKPRLSTKGVIPGNGMEEAGAIVRVNGRVLIDEDGYFRWIDAVNAKRVEGL